MRAAAEIYLQETGRVVFLETTGSDAYLDRLEGSLLAGRADFDLALLSASSLPLWVSYNALQPVMAVGSNLSIEDNEQTLELLRPWLANMMYSGDIYGFPAQPAPEVLWYRSDWLAEAGLQPPATWEAFEQAALALARPPDRWGAALAAGESGPGFEFAAMLAGFRGQWYESPYEPSTGMLPSSDLHNPPVVALSLNQTETERALAYYGGLFQAEGLAVPGSQAAGRAQAAAALREGRAAMAILPLTMAAGLLDCAAGPASCTPQGEGPAMSLLSFAPLPGLPQGVATGELNAWVIPLHAAHAQAAREFVAWLVGPVGSRVWAEAGGIPAWVDRQALDAEAFERASYLALLEGVQEYRLPYPPVKTAAQVEAALRSAASSAAVGRYEPAEVEEALRQALYQGGYSVK